MKIVKCIIVIIITAMLYGLVSQCSISSYDVKWKERKWENWTNSKQGLRYRTWNDPTITQDRIDRAREYKPLPYSPPSFINGKLIAFFSIAAIIICGGIFLFDSSDTENRKKEYKGGGGSTKQTYNPETYPIRESSIRPNKIIYDKPVPAPASSTGLDPLFCDAAKFVVNSQQGSTSMIQRNFSIGFKRAGGLMEQLEKMGVVGPQIGSRPREVLIKDPQTLESLFIKLEPESTANVKPVKSTPVDNKKVLDDKPVPAPASSTGLDPLFGEVARFVVDCQQGSTSMIQRNFSIGFKRAGGLMEQLEKMGVVGPQIGSRPREVLIKDPHILESLLNTESE